MINLLTMRQNLQAVVAGETHEYTNVYPGMTKVGREEGFDEVPKSSMLIESILQIIPRMRRSCRRIRSTPYYRF